MTKDEAIVLMAEMAGNTTEEERIELFMKTIADPNTRAGFDTLLELFKRERAAGTEIVVITVIAVGHRAAISCHGTSTAAAHELAEDTLEMYSQAGMSKEEREREQVERAEFEQATIPHTEH